jgi:hypothetical protein
LRARLFNKRVFWKVAVHVVQFGTVYIPSGFQIVYTKVAETDTIFLSSVLNVFSFYLQGKLRTVQ